MIHVQHLTKDYEGFIAVRDVTFDVSEGDIFGFIGPNGAGKTTTIRMLATLIEPTDGAATIGGLSVIDDPDAVRRTIGYMPDYYGVYDGITVEEYLDFFAAAYDIPRRQRRPTIGDVMDLCDLGNLRHKLVEGLSKGMKQRLCLAKTLVHDPKVLILDEPAAGLDPRARIELRALLKELSSMGKTILISSHILTELSDICNTVGIIERGEILATGLVTEISNKLSERSETRGVKIVVLANAAEAEAILTGEGEVVAVHREGRELHVAYQGDDKTVPRLVRRLVMGEIDVCGVTEEREDLETIFMKVTTGQVA